MIDGKWARATVECQGCGSVYVTWINYEKEFAK